MSRAFRPEVRARIHDELRRALIRHDGREYWYASDLATAAGITKVHENPRESATDTGGAGIVDRLRRALERRGRANDPDYARESSDGFQVTAQGAEALLALLDGEHRAVNTHEVRTYLESRDVPLPAISTIPDDAVTRGELDTIRGEIEALASLLGEQSAPAPVAAGITEERAEEIVSTRLADLPLVPVVTEERVEAIARGVVDEAPATAPGLSEKQVEKLLIEEMTRLTERHTLFEARIERLMATRADEMAAQHNAFESRLEERVHAAVRERLSAVARALMGSEEPPEPRATVIPLPSLWPTSKTRPTLANPFRDGPVAPKNVAPVTERAYRVSPEGTSAPKEVTQPLDDANLVRDANLIAANGIRQPIRVILLVLHARAKGHSQRECGQMAGVSRYAASKIIDAHAAITGGEEPAALIPLENTVADNGPSAAPSDFTEDEIRERLPAHLIPDDPFGGPRRGSGGALRVKNMCVPEMLDAVQALLDSRRSTLVSISEVMGVRDTTLRRHLNAYRESKLG